MSDQWIIKPVGGQNLEVTVPDSFKIDTTENIDVTVLQRAIAQYLEKQRGSEVDACFCVSTKPCLVQFVW